MTWDTYPFEDVARSRRGDRCPIAPMSLADAAIHGAWRSVVESPPICAGLCVVNCFIRPVPTSSPRAIRRDVRGYDSCGPVSNVQSPSHIVPPDATTAFIRGGVRACIAHAGVLVCGETRRRVSEKTFSTLLSSLDTPHSHPSVGNRLLLSSTIFV